VPELKELAPRPAESEAPVRPEWAEPPVRPEWVERFDLRRGEARVSERPGPQQARAPE
jgi:hypothetical protein